MTPPSVPLALKLVMVAVLLAAGCAGQADFNYTTVNTTTKDSQLVLVTQTIQTQCSSVLNATPWIIINPISDHYVSDVFEINGTTNLDVNNLIKIEIYQAKFSRTPRTFTYTYTGLWENVTVHSEACGKNRWSLMTNTSGFNPDEYLIVLTSGKPSVDNRSLFKLNPLSS